MKLALVHPAFGAWGGAENVILWQCRALAQRGRPVTVLTGECSAPGADLARGSRRRGAHPAHDAGTGMGAHPAVAGTDPPASHGGPRGASRPCLHAARGQCPGPRAGAVRRRGRAQLSCHLVGGRGPPGGAGRLAPRGVVVQRAAAHTCTRACLRGEGPSVSPPRESSRSMTGHACRPWRPSCASASTCGSACRPSMASTHGLSHPGGAPPATSRRPGPGCSR